jgi:hypothetical protein
MVLHSRQSEFSYMSSATFPFSFSSQRVASGYERRKGGNKKQRSFSFLFLQLCFGKWISGILGDGSRRVSLPSLSILRLLFFPCVSTFTWVLVDSVHVCRNSYAVTIVTSPTLLDMSLPAQKLCPHIQLSLFCTLVCSTLPQLQNAYKGT